MTVKTASYQQWKCFQVFANCQRRGIQLFFAKNSNLPLTDVKMCGKLNTITRNAFMVVGIQPFFLQKSMLKIFQKFGSALDNEFGS